MSTGDGQVHYLSDGQTYLIPNPGLCWINRGSLYIARTDRPDSVLMDDVDLVWLRHIVRIEQVNGAPPQNGASDVAA